jgi:hypothetical protein
MKLGRFASATVTVGVAVEAAAAWLVAAMEAVTSVVVAPVPVFPPPRVAPLLVFDVVETAACEVADDALVAAAVRCGEAAFPSPVECSVEGGAETVDTALVADATAAAPDDAVARCAGTTSPEGENANLEMLAVARTSGDAEAREDGAAVSDDAVAAPFSETGVDASALTAAVCDALVAAIFVVAATRDAGADTSDESAIGALAAVAVAAAAAAATGGTGGDASELAASALVAVDGGLASVEFAVAAARGADASEATAVALATVGAALSVVEFALAAAAATRGDVVAVPALGEELVADALRFTWSCASVNDAVAAVGDAPKLTEVAVADALLADWTVFDELAAVAALCKASCVAVPAPTPNFVVAVDADGLA